MKKIIVITFLILSSTLLRAQDKNKSFWEILKGKELESSITFLPVGSHTKNIDLIGIWYTSFNYKSFEIAGFKNSYDDLTIALIYKREIPLAEKLSLIYGLGIMQGYKGRLKDVSGIPFKNTFLFKGDINPTGGIVFDYRVAKKISVQLNISPVVVVYGVRYIL